MSEIFRCVLGRIIANTTRLNCVCQQPQSGTQLAHRNPAISRFLQYLSERPADGPTVV